MNNLNTAIETQDLKLMYVSHVMRKHVFGVCNQVRLKLARSADETS